jgi:plastocyanin
MNDPQTHRRIVVGITVLCALGVTALAAAAPALRSDEGDNRPARVAMRDDCDPTDPGWAQAGGCARAEGDVSRAEFAAELASPLSAAVVGHQAWRNDPPYLQVKEGERVRVTNEGGRVHTFTEVAQFGGGKAPNPAFSRGLAQSPECPGSLDVAPGDGIVLAGLGVGNHRFICCIHPWMRALIKVKPRGGHER